MKVLWIVALVACGPKATTTATEAVPWDRSGVDWSRPPMVAREPVFAPLPVFDGSLSNGVRVIVVENHRLPLVAVTIVNRAAGGREDKDTPGMAAVVADMLDEHRALPIGQLDIYAASDHASLQLVTSTSMFAAALHDLVDMIRNPHFDAVDFGSVRARRLDAVRERARRPRTIAAQLFDRITFVDHPYAFEPEGTVDSLSGMQFGYAVQFQMRAYRPDATTIVIAGDLGRAQAHDLLEHEIGNWHAKSQLAAPSAKHPAARAQLAYVDMPGAEQTIVLLGCETAAAGAPDQLAGEVANSIFGGGIGSRLDEKLHDELAIALGPSSSYWHGQLASSWTVGATFKTDATVRGIQTILAMIDDMRAHDVTAAELATARTNLLRGAAQTFDTMAGTARALERLVAQGLPAQYYATYADRLAAITAGDVRRAAQEWTNLTIVVVGDWSKIGPGLSALQLRAVQYDAAGTIVK